VDSVDDGKESGSHGKRRAKKWITEAGAAPSRSTIVVDGASAGESAGEARTGRNDEIRRGGSFFEISRNRRRAVSRI
jgi:hypothetical protein